MDKCRVCGKPPPRLGGAYPKNAFCFGHGKRKTPLRAVEQNTTFVSPGLSVAEQLAVLAKLRKEGSLTEQEFQALKTRLISGDKL